LDLVAGDREAAARDASAAGAALPGAAAAGQPWPTATIPGPLRPFARMAAISPTAPPEDILPALARNVVTGGYTAAQGSEGLEQTEYLKLVHRYLSQARELENLAGERKVVGVPACDSPVAADLLRILGFRMRGGCGSDVVLETVNASRAFLTTDSGFPLNQLEEALRTNRPFAYDFHPTPVPVLFGPEYWMAGAKEPGNFIESFISDPAVCRLYLGFSKLDPDTAGALRTCWTFSAACSNSATEGWRFPAARAPWRRGRNWWALRPPTARSSWTSWSPRTTGGCAACTTPWRASAARCATT
jgi:hypothetical protein